MCSEVVLRFETRGKFVIDSLGNLLARERSGIARRTRIDEARVHNRVDCGLVEWLDDVKGWKTGDEGAAERLREYVTPFVHGALLARLTHHVTNALMAEALERVMTVADAPPADTAFVHHAVQVARSLARSARKSDGQERPSTDASVAEGRQWLERVRKGLPEDARELVLWRLVEGIPGPELREVLSLDERTVRTVLERGIGETMAPSQSLGHLPYVWDLSGEPTPQLARAETSALALRFDPSATPEPADVVYTAATFQDLNDAKVGDRPQANPFGDTSPTQVHAEAKGKLSAAGRFTDEKTEGAFDLPAAARELQARTETETPVLKGKIPPPVRAGTFKSEPKVAPVVDDDRPSRRKVIDERRGSDVGRRETREAPVETTPMTPIIDDDERPSRSKLQVKGKGLEEAAAKRRGGDLGPEEPSSRRRSPELGPEEPSARRRAANPEDSGRKRNPEQAEESQRRKNPELAARPRVSDVPPRSTDTGASQPSIEQTDPEGPKKITERYTPQPVNPLVRIGVVAAIAFVLLLAIAWRLGLF